MENENIDMRFALIAENNDLLYPYKKHQKETGRYGYALTAPGEQDRHGKGHYTLDISEVVRRLVFDRWNVRAKSISGDKKKREGSIGIGKSAIKGYWISDELKHLVSNAKIEPISLPNMQRDENQGIYSHTQDDVATNSSAIEAGTNDLTENLAETILSDLNHAVESLTSEYPSMTGEDIDVIAKRRIGQGPFRRLLEKQHGTKCCLSGIEKRELLIASHIVPWSKSDRLDKVDPDNGLLLSVSWDSVFDKGLVTFGDNGEVIFSQDLDEFSAKTLGMSKDANIPKHMLNDKRRTFLKYHRDNIFRGVGKSLV